MESNWARRCGPAVEKPEMSIDLTQVEAWREGLGLLAVPLEHGEHRRFVMLNGSRVNFCLDPNPAEILADPRSIAWSADVGHYVRVAGARVTAVSYTHLTLPTIYSV